MLQRKLGSNRFVLCIQLYSFFEDYFKLAAGDIQLDLQRVVNSGNEFNDKQIVHLKMEIEDIRRRITAIENMARQDGTMPL